MSKTNIAKENSIITKKDILYAWFKWVFFSHCCINYERYESLGFTNAISHILAKLYKNKEELGKALERHLEFFNTEPYIGIIIMGITIAMEEERSKDRDVVSGQAITAIKCGLMGPLAGIGDSLNQAIVYPVLLAFSIGLVLQNNMGVGGSIIFVIMILTAMAAESIYFINYGYKLGKDAVGKILQGGLMGRIVTVASIVGCGVLGALTATYVNLSTILTYGNGDAVISLQTDFLDQLMPQMLPLAVTLGCFALIKKGLSPMKIMGITAMGVVVLSLIGIV